MKRILLVLVVAALMAVMLVASAMPAFADGLGPSRCSEFRPGEVFSDVASNPAQGFSGTSNPGTPKTAFHPIVPNIFGCNPFGVGAGE